LNGAGPTHCSGGGGISKLVSPDISPGKGRNSVEIPIRSSCEINFIACHRTSPERCRKLLDFPSTFKETREMRKLCTIISLAFAFPALAEEKPLIIDVPAIAHASRATVEQILGKAEFCRKSKYGVSCRFATHGMEIVFANDKAERIIINDLDDTPFDKIAITRFGFNNQEPDVSTEEVMRWDRIPGIAELSLFPDKDKIDYALIEVTRLPDKK
jgi:hypothetical protein